jgi:hypothetical protein
LEVHVHLGIATIILYYDKFIKWELLINLFIRICLGTQTRKVIIYFCSNKKT